MRLVGKALYPAALTALEPLNVTELVSARAWRDEDIDLGVRTMQELRSQVDRYAGSWLQLTARVSPNARLGTNLIQIGIHNTVTDRPGSIGDYSRVADISATFDNPEKARIGLYGLADVFPDAIFGETVYALQTPIHVKDMFNAHMHTPRAPRSGWISLQIESARIVAPSLEAAGITINGAYSEEQETRQRWTLPSGLASYIDLVQTEPDLQHPKFNATFQGSALEISLNHTTDPPFTNSGNYLLRVKAPRASHPDLLASFNAA